MKNRVINVKGAEITIATRHEQNFISLTDMVRNFDGGGALIEQWLKNKDTVLFLGVWEQLNNAGFNSSNSRELKTRLETQLQQQVEEHTLFTIEWELVC